ncbi:MAG: ATP-binding cassette domain-containing protein [Candidatus Acidiferrales bacterium]
MNSAIRASNLSKCFRSQRVLNSLDLEIPETSVFGLVGPNGAGKTTVIKILMNILKPTSGHCEVFGVDSADLGPADLARIGYVSENQDIPGWMTVEFLMKYLKPFYPTWDDSLASDLLRKFELPPRRKVRHLSRGMWMKTALAASLAYRPRLLVMDEPFSGLDPVVRQDLIEGLLENAEGTTILVSSHDLSDIESFASHIGYLDRGRLQFSEEMTSLTERFREVEVTIEPPAAAPTNSHWPAHWLRRETSPALIRFVETQFEAERTDNEIRQLFGDVRNISVNAMPLRAIFITLARSASKTA